MWEYNIKLCFVSLDLHSQPDSTFISDIYFFGSFAFLIGKAVTVTLLTSKIHDQSKVILPTLYTCPASAYNIEVNTLKEMTVFSKLDLKFFYVRVV